MSFFGNCDIFWIISIDIRSNQACSCCFKKILTKYFKIIESIISRNQIKEEDWVYLSPIIQPLSVYVKIIVITLFVVMLGTLISPTFAQQFKEPNYTIRGAEVSGFEIDQETASLIIFIEPRARGELVITLPRNLIDAKIGFEDIDFDIFIGTSEFNLYDETRTSLDRTLTIPIKRSTTEITIFGTHIFSQVATTQTTQAAQPQTIENRIAVELRNEIPDGKAKLLIYSDTNWSGAYQSSSFDYTEIVGQRDKSFIFGCESSFGRQGVFGAKIEKLTQHGYLTIVAIQNQKIISQGSTHEQFMEVLINGNCVSSVSAGPGGGCLIATATFGSELAPQVQQLRELRDSKLLQTNSGIAFMELFNQFYYTFSPTIADLERENPVFREVVKIAITPMISSLSILNYVDMNSEVEVLGYGISLILLNVGMYVGIPSCVIVGIRKRL